MLLGFSFLGFMMRRLGWPRFPLLLGVVLGDKLETYLRLSYGRFAGSIAFLSEAQGWHERKKEKTGAV
jgi:TctA family transporter